MKHIIASPLAAIALLAWPAQASAELLFNFDSAHPLNSPVVSGYKQNFITTTEQARGGSGSSLKFAHNQPDPYASFTYDVPFDTFTSGIITVWFYDARGSFNTGHGPAKSGGAIILEDKSHPADFVAVEALSYPYGKGGQPAYYGSEGIIDRLATGDRFDSASFPNRTMGFHKVEFHVSAAQTLVYVDGLPSAEVAGPGSGAALRLRFMADSPSNGGSQTDNWITAPNATSAYLGTPWLYFDDISFNRELPSAAVATQDFEIVAGSPEYDAAGVPASPGGPGYPPQNNPHMDGFVNQWDVTTTSTFVRSGEQAAYFANHTPPLRSIAFDLAEAPPGTTVTLWFYDAKGQDEAMDHDNSIIIESGNNPAEFLAVEINNWPYPYGGGTKNYYLTESDGVSSTDFTLWLCPHAPWAGTRWKLACMRRTRRSPWMASSACGVAQASPTIRRLPPDQAPIKAQNCGFSPTAPARAATATGPPQTRSQPAIEFLLNLTSTTTTSVYPFLQTRR